MSPHYGVAFKIWASSVVRSHPGADDGFMKPKGSRGKNPPAAIDDGLAPFVAGQTRAHAQKRMFMAVIRKVTGIETVRTKIKVNRGAHCSYRRYQKSISAAETVKNPCKIQTGPNGSPAIYIQ